MVEAISAAPAIVRVPQTKDIFIRGIEDVEDLGECARFYLYAEQAPIDVQGPVEHHIRAQIVIQWEDVPCAIRFAALAFLRSLRKRASGPFLHLLH